jgi:eukaryotic-like serine/threonine-protein kinase
LKTCPECYNEYEDTVQKCPEDSAKLRAVEKDPLVGTRLADRYEIVSVIGRGGMGVVYKARQEIMDRMMAIKMLHSQQVSEPESVKRFFREAKTVSQVRHHHIVTLYDFGMSPKGQPYIVMDFLEGDSLKHVVKEEGPLSFERAGHVFRQVIEALTCAHGLDVVHRDLKPENIMLSTQNEDTNWVTLVDFGLSKLKSLDLPNDWQPVRAGDIAGSPPYMSPEQCLSNIIVDPRSDIYSLAIVIYESLSGKLPFEVKSAIEMLDRHLYATPIPLNAIPELKSCTETARVLNKALEKDPEKRHQTIEYFGTELHEALMRDSLKIRALKHRVAEVATLQGTLSDHGQAVKPSLDPSKLKDIAGVLDGQQFLAKQADLESEVQRQTGAHAHLPASHGTAVADTADGEGAEPEYCPYCQVPIHKNLRFCLNCQRKVGTPKDRMAVMPTPKSKRTGEQGQGKVSARSKKLADKAMRFNTITQVLRVCLIFVVAYALYAGLSSGVMVEQIKKFANDLHLPVLEQP